MIFAEYAHDAADACHALGVQTVAVTAGYIHAQPRREFFSRMDAANVDLKAFSESFYMQQTGSHLAPVLDTLQHIVHDSRCWLEITTLLIPGLNDSDAELQAMARWIADELGRDVPLHFSAFHPDYRMTEVPRTPPQTLGRARRIAHDAGLRYVYTGNVHDTAGGTTSCPGCGTPVIVRDWHEILHYALDAQGHCQGCGSVLPGRYGPFTPPTGRTRIPVRVAMA